MAGGADSSLGLHQLLWLTQAEFQLPEPKKFDSDVQSRLRNVLGVLQTPLDDRFIGRVKEEWSRWFSVRNRPGERPKIKKDCLLDKALAELDRLKIELLNSESEYQDFEKKMVRSANLEVRSRDLQRQLSDKARVCDLLQQEFETSRNRLENHRFADERVVQAERLLGDRQALRQKREDVERRIREAESSADAAGHDAEEIGKQLGAIERRNRELQGEIQVLDDAKKELQGRLAEVVEWRELLNLTGQIRNALENRQRAEQAAHDLEELKKRARDRPAPEDATVRRLKKTGRRPAASGLTWKRPRSC